MKYELGPVHVRQGRKLPHWDAPWGIYFVTWHLADAVPEARRMAIDQECAYIAARLRQQRKSLIISAEVEMVRRLRRRLINRALDESLGACVLRDPRAAQIVADAICFFDSVRYDLYAWCVMPNHGHAVFTLHEGWSVDQVMKSWKGYTAREVNRILGRRGTLWESESFDRTIRDSRQLQNTIAYVLGNPLKAELVDWPHVASYPERIARGL